MSECRTLDPLVTPYVDGELAPPDRKRVEQHMCACAPCASRVSAEQAVRDLLRVHQPALQTQCASELLRARCRAHAAGVDARVASAADGRNMPVPGGAVSPLRPTTRLMPWAAAAMLVVIVGGAFLYQATARSSRMMAAELAADHLKCFAINALLRPHQSASAVESWMASGFGWNMHLPADAAGEGLELIGSRLCLYGEGKVAHIMYRHRGQPVSLFMLPSTVRQEELVQVLGHQCAIWSSGERTFVLVSSENPAEVEHLAAFVHRALE